MNFQDCLQVAQRAVLLSIDYPRNDNFGYNEFKIDGIIVYRNTELDIKLYRKNSFEWEFVKFDFIDMTIEENFFQGSTLYDDETLLMMVIFSALRKSQSNSTGFFVSELFNKQSPIVV